MGIALSVVESGVFPIAIVAVIALLALGETQRVTMQSAAEDEAGRIFSHVMSPYCPGKLLADCTSPAAADLRAEIRARLEAGEDADAVERDLYARFGDSIRAVPGAGTRTGRVLRIAPGVALLASLVAVAWYLKRRQGNRASPREITADPELERRLERELEDAGEQP
jgi:cytochrome c-type biogenesis protein CcmH